jgi:uncharacterized membrane protein YdbT with pleckstrin-like domain
MMYVDAPGPGGGYLIFNLLVVLFLLLIPLSLRMKEGTRRKLFLPVAVISLCGVVAFAIIIHAGFETRYAMDDRNLYIRSGLIQRTTVPLGLIEHVGREPLIWQPVGFTLKWKGYSNRYVNGISLTTKNRVIFLSPADTERFLREIHIRIGNVRSLE